MSAHGKRYKEARSAVDREREYTPVEAIKLLKDSGGAKFDETVEVHLNLGLNVRHAEEQLRGTLMLPHGTGREQRVAVFAEGEKAREAEEAGADVVGAADLAKRVEEGFTDFDVAIATPDLMGQVGRLVLLLAIDLRARVEVLLPVLGHQPVTSTPMDRAVPSMILDA